MKCCREREESVTSRTKTPQSLSFFWWGMPWGDKAPQLCGAKQTKSTFTWSETLNVWLRQPAFPTPPHLRTVSQSSRTERNQTILLFRTAGFETGQVRKKESIQTQINPDFCWFGCLNQQKNAIEGAGLFCEKAGHRTSQLYHDQSGYANLQQQWGGTNEGIYSTLKNIWLHLQADDIKFTLMMLIFHPFWKAICSFSFASDKRYFIMFWR